MKVPVQIMHTEDDTFNMLRRTPIREMIVLWLESPYRSWKTESTEKFFNYHSWTVKDFKRAWIEFNGGVPV